MLLVWCLLLSTRNTEKFYNGGQWTKSRFQSFIKSALRAASNRWGPKFTCIKEARTKRGWYRCVGYERKAHEVPASLPSLKGKKRIKNIYADHILPVIDPATGFQSWDEVIRRLFVERDGYQALCSQCHAHKTADEKEQRKSRN